jgi:hypothetical protein
MRTQKDYFWRANIVYIARTIIERSADTCLMSSGNRSVSVRDWNNLNGLGMTSRMMR